MFATLWWRVGKESNSYLLFRTPTWVSFDDECALFWAEPTRPRRAEVDLEKVDKAGRISVSSGAARKRGFRIPGPSDWARRWASRKVGLRRCFDCKQKVSSANSTRKPNNYWYVCLIWDSNIGKDSFMPMYMEKFHLFYSGAFSTRKTNLSWD